MREPVRKPVDLVSVLRATQYAQACVAHAEQLVNDPNRAGRLDKGECRVCFYGGRQGGSMTTKALCGLCGAEIMFANTCVDVLCLACAVAHSLCRHCGADVELSNRRKL